MSIKSKSIPEQVKELLQSHYFSIDSSTTLYSLGHSWEEEGVVTLMKDLTITQKAINEAIVNVDGTVEVKDQNGNHISLDFYGVNHVGVNAVPLDMHGSVLSDGMKVVCVDSSDKGDDPKGLVAGGQYTVDHSYFEDGLLTPMVVIKELDCGAMFSDRFIAVKPITKIETVNDFNPC